MKILGFAGLAQGGKSSGANFVAGTILKNKNKIKYFKLDEEGRLVVNSYFKDKLGNLQESEGILDLARSDWDFSQYAKDHIWPHTKHYALADPLKQILINFYGLTYEQVYGTNEQKNNKSPISWEVLSKILDAVIYNRLYKKRKYDDFLSCRELMQIFGSEICRGLDPVCHARTCINRVVEDSSDFALITDIRFDDEIQYIHKIGGKIILLTKCLEKSDHTSEQILNLPPESFDYIIDNDKCDIDTKNREILIALSNWGWI